MSKCKIYRFLQRATAEARRSSSTASRAECASPQCGYCMKQVRTGIAQQKFQKAISL
jgi:hypothetical protein